jgi:hypothetical protein
VSVEKSEVLHLEYVVRDRARGISALGVIDLDADTAGTAKSSVLLAMPPGESIAAFWRRRRDFSRARVCQVRRDVTRREVHARGTKAHTRDRVVRVADWAGRIWSNISRH